MKGRDWDSLLREAPVFLLRCAASDMLLSPPGLPLFPILCKAGSCAKVILRSEAHAAITISGQEETGLEGNPGAKQGADSSGKA